MTTLELPMAPDQVRWFLGGRDFLAAVGSLPNVRVVARCRRCVGAGSAASAVVVEISASGRRAAVRCACRAGSVKLDHPLDLAPLLDALGWVLTCPACGDAVRGDNDPTAATLTITCSCTSRVFANPAPAVVARETRVRELGGGRRGESVA